MVIYSTLCHHLYGYYLYGGYIYKYIHMLITYIDITYPTIYIYPTICHYISPVKYRSNVLIWIGYFISPLTLLLSMWWLYKYIHMLIIYMDITYPTIYMYI